MKTAIGLGASLALHASVAAVLMLHQPKPEVRVEVKPAVVTKPATRVALASPLPRPGGGPGEGKEQQKKVRARRPAALDVAEAPAVVADVIAAEPEAPAEEPAASEVAPALGPLTPALSPPEVREAFDVTALHAALAESARRCYPAAAKRFHLTGEAQLAFCLDASGGLKSTTLASSTGQSVLDAAAKDCVIAGAMPLPARAAGGCYTVPVRFR